MSKISRVLCVGLLVVLFLLLCSLLAPRKSGPEDKKDLHKSDKIAHRFHNIFRAPMELPKSFNKDQVFYNRAPKCGSRSVLSTIKVLSKSLNYNVYDVEKPSNYGVSTPAYINVIRDPVNGLISHYYYNAHGSSNSPLSSPRPHFNMSLDECVQNRMIYCMNIHFIIPFFCGHNEECRTSNPASLSRAKRAVKESYVIVGITEDLHAFMSVLEFILPRFFKNASSVFAEQEKKLFEKYKTVNKPNVSHATRILLKKHLEYEYDFYNFVKARFYELRRQLHVRL